MERNTRPVLLITALVITMFLLMLSGCAGEKPPAAKDPGGTSQTTTEGPGDISEPANDDPKAEFQVRYGDKTFKLGDWDNQVSLEEILGKPDSATVEQLGPGADTFTGSYIKNLVYDGLELRLMSPKDNGKTFFIDKIRITNNKYLTAKDVKVGDTYEDLLRGYNLDPPAAGSGVDPENQVYSISYDMIKYIRFEVKNGGIMSIELETLHP